MRCRSCLPFAPKPLSRCSASLHYLLKWGQIGTCVKARPACRLRLRFCHGFRGSAVAPQQKHTPEAWRYRARSQPHSTSFRALLLSPLVSARRGLAGRLDSDFFPLPLQFVSIFATPFPLCVGNASQFPSLRFGYARGHKALFPCGAVVYGRGCRLSVVPPLFRSRSFLLFSAPKPRWAFSKTPLRCVFVITRSQKNTQQKTPLPRGSVIQSLLLRACINKSKYIAL